MTPAIEKQKTGQWGGTLRRPGLTCHVDEAVFVVSCFFLNGAERSLTNLPCGALSACFPVGCVATSQLTNATNFSFRFFFFLWRDLGRSMAGGGHLLELENNVRPYCIPFAPSSSLVSSRLVSSRLAGDQRFACEKIEVLPPLLFFFAQPASQQPASQPAN